VNVARLAENFLLWCETFGIKLFPWQHEAFGEATRREHGKFVHQLSGISVPRGDGKSKGAAAVGCWRATTGPQPQLLVTIALDYEGGKVITTHAKNILQSHPDLCRGVEFLADEIRIPSTGTRWLIRSREHFSSRGLHPDGFFQDEGGWSDTEHFSSLLAAQSPIADPFGLVVSTLGRRQGSPLQVIKQQAEEGAPGVYWYWRSKNSSPLVSPAFLARQKKLLMPAQYALEHENTISDAADSFTTAAEVDDAMDGSWVETPTGEPGRRYVLAVDLGAVHDPTVLGVGHEEDGLICVDKLVTLQGSHEHPVQMLAVERTFLDLAAAFPPVRGLVESWQGLASVQSLQRLGHPVELATPTAKSNAEQWGTLSQLLASRRLVLPVHDRLRQELLGLSYEVGPAGIKVTDQRAVHQDHAVVVRMLAHALVSQPRTLAMVW
jgi:hypothetical protein